MNKPHPLTTTAGRVAKLLAIAESLEASMAKNYTKEILNQYRAILDDIAKETGGRQKVETGPTWKDKIIAALRSGRITEQAVTERFGDQLAREIFKAAGERPQTVQIYIPDNGRD